MSGFVVLLVVVGVIAMLVASSNAAAKRLREAHAAYKDSLARLKKDPSNPDLKQETLALGRAYSNLTRQNKGVTVFDEVALSNDIGAACAAASAHQSSAQMSSPEARLARLADLRQKGLVSDEEYQNQRGKILREL